MVVVELTKVCTAVTVDVTVVNVSTRIVLVNVGVGTCKQLQMLDCCALLSPLNCAGWPLLTGTLDVLTEFALEVGFFDVVLLVFFDVETGFKEDVVFLLLVTTFLGIVETALFVLVVFFKMVMTFGVLVGFLLVEVTFLMVDDFGLLVAFFTIWIFLVVVGFFVDVAFLRVVVLFVLVFFALDVFLIDVFLLETAAFARSSKSRFLMPPLAVAELDGKSANPVDDAVLLALVIVVFENKVPLVELVAFDEE